MKRFKKDAPVYFDYKDVKTLQRYINIYGQIEPIAKTVFRRNSSASSLSLSSVRATSR